MPCNLEIFSSLDVFKSSAFISIRVAFVIFLVFLFFFVLVVCGRVQDVSFVVLSCRKRNLPCCFRSSFSLIGVMGWFSMSAYSIFSKLGFSSFFSRSPSNFSFPISWTSWYLSRARRSRIGNVASWLVSL